MLRYIQYHPAHPYAAQIAAPTSPEPFSRGTTLSSLGVAVTGIEPVTSTVSRCRATAPTIELPPSSWAPAVGVSPDFRRWPLFPRPLWGHYGVSHGVNREPRSTQRAQPSDPLRVLAFAIHDGSPQVRRISALTHADSPASDACVLWSIAIDRAVREATLDRCTDGLALLAPGDQRAWAVRIEQALTSPPGSFAPNGFVVPAFQAALAAIKQTPIPTDTPPAPFPARPAGSSGHRRRH